MNKTTASSINIQERIMLTTPELQGLLGCGRKSAIDIGTDAKAKVQIGKRVLWNREKIQKYLGDIAI